MSVGGFHRAHLAVYIDDMCQDHGDRDWGICGVGLLKSDARMRDALIPQDTLYSVIERSQNEERARIIGSMCEYMHAPQNPERVLMKMSSPSIRIVSLTVTEGGYFINEGTGEFDADRPDIEHDLHNPNEPITAVGYVVEALNRRRRDGIAPFTLLSCDNLQTNGEVAKKIVLAFAERRDSTLRNWIERNVTFPNCMVDRITPATTEEDRTMVRQKFGIDDAWPVVCEPFRQWVVEDDFCNGRPQWERLGVQMTNDVLPYELVKLRLLNASHSAMGYLGYLAGFAYIHEIIVDPHFELYVRTLMDREVTPLLKEVPGIDLDDYKRTLIDRFANPAIKDTAARICLDGSSKLPKFILPSISEQLALGGPIKMLTLVVASWIRYLNGTDESGQPIVIDDPLAEKLTSLAKAGGRDPSNLLNVRELFGDLGQSKIFVGQLSKTLEQLYADGARATLAHHLK